MNITNNPRTQLVGSVVAMVMIANLQYAWTLFVKPMQTETGWALSQIQWAFTLFIICQTWVQPLEGWLIDRMGPRFFITIAGVLCGGGWALMGSARTPMELYTYYCLAGVGAAFVYSGSIGSALKWFPNRRGFASGVIAAGFGGGTALFIPLIATLIKNHNYHAAFLWTGIIQGVVILAVAQFLRHPGPDFAKTAAKGAANPKARRNTEQFTTSEMLRTPQFYMLYMMFVAMATGGLLVTAQAGPVAVSWGLSAATLTTATALSPVANGASRIFWGLVSDRTGRETAMSIVFLLQAACLMAVLILGRMSGTLFIVTLVLVFFTWGEVFSLFPSTLGDYFGSRNATSNYGFLYTAKGVASIIGGGLAALLFEKFGSWTAAFYGSAALAFVSGLMAFGLRLVPLPRKAVKSEPAPDAVVRGETG
ncbi:MAG: oxalate/formate MFS antiporter [Acidobacteria bacterium RIFCSPLOWO2_12_FULL_59_11]|nr:MAG: oxalate/formate MFS antiporter [Acidobacteria bacterium RIFCSPLOWO2_12_FULL_59_11]